MDNDIENDRMIMNGKRSKRHRKQKKHPNVHGINVNNGEIVIISDNEEEYKDGSQLSPLSTMLDTSPFSLG